MTGDFNIWDSLWDLSYSHHASISNDLLIIADLFNLNLLTPTNQVLTRYSDNINNTNSVIDLIFLQCSSTELDNHLIQPDWYLTSDHTLLTVTISIIKEYVNSRKISIVKDSKEKASFIKDVIVSIRNLNTSSLLDIPSLENVTNNFANSIDNAWMKNSKIINIMKHLKSLWNNNCSRDLEKYRNLKSLEDWKIFCRMVKDTK